VEKLEQNKFMNNDIWFYDRYGAARILFLRAGRFVDRQGNALGYIHDNQFLYGFSGRHCGWYENGIIRDLNGQVVAFMDGANDFPSPILPIRQIPPIPAISKIPPIPAIRQISRIKPIKKFGWSEVDPVNLFK